eukprot:SAG25_NODE_881_length_4969_cov_53.695072_1_plen_151_part_00
MVDRTTNSYAHHRPIPPWTARTGRRDIARGRTYSRLDRGPGGVTDLHAARPTPGPHHCREVPRKDDTTATFSLRLERAIQRAAADYDFFKKGLGVYLGPRYKRRRHAAPPPRPPGAWLALAPPNYSYHGGGVATELEPKWFVGPAGRHTR